MTRKPSRIKEELVSSLEIPRDLAYRDAMVSITGNTSLCIENYKCILEYNRESILVLTKNSRIQITGCQLEITSYTNDEMMIRGHMKEISFLD